MLNDDLKNTEETSVDNQETGVKTPDGNDQPSKEETGDEDVQSSEESVETLKARLATVEKDRDNYRKGLLSLKAKDRSLNPLESTPVEETPKPKKEVDVAEEKVLKVLFKQNERQILREVINPDSSYYLPDLVDDIKYNEIIGYLPLNIDRSTPQNIHRGLKAAIAAWREDRGIVVKKNSSNKTAQASLTETKGGAGGENIEVKKTKKRILKKATTPKDWY